MQLRRRSSCVYIDNFLTNQLVKEFSKSVHICPKYYQTLRGIVFGTQCRIHRLRILEPWCIEYENFFQSFFHHLFDISTSAVMVVLLPARSMDLGSVFSFLKIGRWSILCDICSLSTAWATTCMHVVQMSLIMLLVLLNVGFYLTIGSTTFSFYRAMRMHSAGASNARSV